MVVGDAVLNCSSIAKESNMDWLEQQQNIAWTLRHRAVKLYARQTTEARKERAMRKVVFYRSMLDDLDRVYESDRST